jgi:hypothetical protein
MGPRFLLAAITASTMASGIASHALSGCERGSGTIQQSVSPRGRTGAASAFR